MNKLSVIDGETLLDMDLNAPRFCVQNFLPQGLSILGGAPKMGKSWLVMDLCVRIAKGEAMWNMETTQGTTLYLCLEDPYFRVQQRLGCITDEAPPNVFFANAASTLAEDLEQQIIEFVKDHPDTVLIVIDTFQMVRASNGEPSYGGDYQELQKLKWIADALRISILLVHHLRKQGDRDPINRLSGTTGIGGAVDAIFILDKDERNQNHAKLICTGRDIEHRELELRFNKESCVWDMISDSLDSPENLLPQEMKVELAAILLDDIRRVTHFARQNEMLFAKHISQKQSKEAQKEIAQLQREVDSLNRRQAELTALFKRLYEDNVLGRIPDEQYRILSQGYTEEQKQLKERLPVAEARLEELKAAATNVARFLENAKKYSHIEELTSEILRTFIQKVTIGERSKKHSRNAVQEIKIYYRDVGLLDDMPEADAADAALVAESQVTEKVA